jgi:hypothetical protein
MTDPHELSTWQSRLEKARNGRELLDLLLSASDAKRRVRQMPAQDLYHYVTRIGLADSAELLALTTPEQVQAFLDFEAWRRDRLSVKRLDPWLETLLHAGPEVLYRSLMALDDELLNWIVRRSVTVIAIEDPDDFHPPEGEYVLTPDGRMCIVFPEPSPRDLPIKIFLDALMRNDPAYCYNLLVHAASALDSVLEDTASRWRAGRMADLGYVDPHEALVVYTPPRPDQIRAARASMPGDGAPPTHWLAPVVEPADRLQAALDRLDANGRRTMQEGLTLLVNMALAADRVEAWDVEGQKPVLDRVRAGLLLGLDALAGPEGDAARDAALLAETSLIFVFRTGYARALEVAGPLRRAARDRKLAGPGGRVDAVDLSALRPWAESLTRRHPERPDGRPFASPVELEEARRAVDVLIDVVAAAGDDRPEDAALGAWLFTRLTLDLLGLEGTTLPSDQLEHAREALFARGVVRPEARLAARDAWRRMGGRTEAALDALLAEAEEQIGGVAPETRLEARFVPIWRVGRPTA